MARWSDDCQPELAQIHTQRSYATRHLELTNNRAENAIRPFVLGRKNWLFSATVPGAKASANLYSLVETARACGLEPYSYLRHVFTELPKATTVEQIEALLPYRCEPRALLRTLPESSAVNPAVR